MVGRTGGMLSVMTLTVAPAGPDELPASAHRLGVTPAAASAGHLLVARRAGRLVGAVFAAVHPDRLADVRRPAADDPAAAAALAVGLVSRLRSAGAAVAQCLLPAGDACPALEEAGFRRVTRLITLVRPPGPVAGSPGPLRFGPTADLTETFAATLIGSRDLPELTGLRSPAAELAGYPAARRLVARLAGVPVGVLLLAPGEVVYLGLVPEARGRGLGTHLLRHALAGLGGGRVTVSGDERNRPALRLYARQEFRPTSRQEVLLWTPGQ